MVSRSLYVGFHVARNLGISLFFVPSRICVCTVLFFSLLGGGGGGGGVSIYLTIWVLSCH